MASSIKDKLQQQASELGFDAFGVCAIEVELRRDYYLDWIGQGKHGSMEWMERNNDRRLYPKNVVGEAKSIVALGMNYYQPNPERRGRIAKYALGLDYHKVIYKRLKRLCSVMRDYGGEQKPYVDTGPILEKSIAELAGIGWQGKSTILLNRKQGTWLFLGMIITTLELEPDSTMKDRCGSCNRCMVACPTNAITAPYELDARKCISYLTIEHDGPIPLEYRKAIGDRVYGCDDCLDVCPWNRWAEITRETKFAVREYPDLRTMLSWSEEDFENQFRGTPIKRAKLNRWLRNVCIVLGNIGNMDDVPLLQTKLKDVDSVVAESAQWAIDQIVERTQQK